MQGVTYIAGTFSSSTVGIFPNSGTFTISGTDMQQITIMEASGKLVRQMADRGIETGRVVVTVH